MAGRELARWRWFSSGILARWFGFRVEVGDTSLLWTGGGFGYRLRSWPHLRQRDRTAAVYRALSAMSTRNVSVAWFARRTGLAPPDAQELLDLLTAQGHATEVRLASGDRAELGNELITQEAKS